MVKNSKKSVPVSLEGERRKAMMLVYSVEKYITHFNKKYFKKPKNNFNNNTNDFIAFVLENTGASKRRPNNFREFAMLMDKTRNTSALLYREEMLDMDDVIARQRAFEDVINNGVECIDEALADHAARYCHSFASETGGIDVRCVQDYENNITRWKSMIKDVKSLLFGIQNSLKDLGTPFDHFVRNYSEILHYIGLSLGVFPRLCNPLKDWMIADEAYVRKLSDEINVLTNRSTDIKENCRRHKLKADNCRHKVTHQTYKCKQINGKLIDAMDERKFCRRREIAVMDTFARFAKELEQKQIYVDQTLSKLYVREPNARAMYDRLSSTLTSVQDDVIRLEKRLGKLQKTLDNVRKERYLAQKAVYRLQVLYDKTSRSENLVNANVDTEVAGVKVMEGDNRMVIERIEILKAIKSLKTNPLTIRHIYTDGYIPGRAIDISDHLLKAFKLIAQDVGRDWPYLYQKLPFFPPRGFASRTYDIELIDLSAQRHDLSLRETTVKCLERWRRLSHDASIPNLIKTLKAVQKKDLANRLQREMIVTS